MNPLYSLVDQPTLESPVLVMVLKGWIDAGLGAADAGEVLAQNLERHTVARFDADQLLDWRARRPTMRLVDGINTHLAWEETELSWAKDKSGRDILLLLGNEPDHAWMAFSEQVVDLAVQFGSRMVLGLGAYPTPAPHTRPPLIAAAASEAALTLGLLRNTVEVPSGVQGMIERQAARRNLPAVGLWAQVPHYVATMPYPAASLALIETTNTVAGLDLPIGDLVDRAAVSQSRIDELIAQNPEHTAMLEQLEQHADQDTTTSELSATSGEDLAEELERFLRDH